MSAPPAADPSAGSPSAARRGTPLSACRSRRILARSAGSKVFDESILQILDLLRSSSSKASRNGSFTAVVVAAPGSERTADAATADTSTSTGVSQPTLRPPSPGRVLEFSELEPCLKTQHSDTNAGRLVMLRLGRGWG